MDEQVSASLTYRAYKVNQLQCYEADAAQQIGINLYQLMENAGAAVFSQVQQYYPQLKHMLVVCGKGNNGGDGYVIARLAKQAGIQVTVLVNADQQAISGDAKKALVNLLADETDIQFCQHSETMLQHLERFSGQLIVDCLFGIGFKGRLASDMVKVIATINQKPCQRLSVDVPSGLNADTGLVLDNAVLADITVTLIAYKRGLLTGQAQQYTGKLLLAELSANAALAALTPSEISWQQPELLPALPTRTQYAHKGSIGTLLTAGGHSAYSGAIRLCSEAALRSGAAMVAVCCHHQTRQVLLANRPELMMLASCSEELKQSALLKKIRALVLGPGLGLDTWSQQIYQQLISVSCPKVIDADALTLLAERPKKGDWVLTPHPGEAARLLSCTIAEIEADRFAAVEQIAAKYGGICVLKGPGSLISDGTKTWINSSGNAGMASGGMGDVLAGIIGALLLQMPDLLSAARLGVYIHGRAADIIAQQHGQIGMLASDLLPIIQKLLNKVESL